MKPVGVEVPARGHRRAVAQHQVLLHRQPAQVDDPVLQAHRLGEVLVVELERRRLRRVQDLDIVRQHLDLAGEQVRIVAALGAGPHESRHADHELVAQRLGDREGRDPVRIEDDLHEALAVAQVDEDDAAVVAAAVHPAHQRHGLGEVAAVDAAAVIGALQGILQRCCGRNRSGGVGSVRTASARAARDGAAARRRQPLQFRGSAAGAGGRRGALPGAPHAGGRRRRGETTPIEMMYLSASSTDMSSSRTLSFGTMTK